MTLNVRAPAGRFIGAGLLAALALGLAACSGGSAGSVVVGPVGTSTGVAISTSSGTSQIQQATSVVLSASVTNDVNNAGVTWTLDGAGGPPGALSNQTTTSVTYTAPANITGTTTPVITATSIADPTKAAAATMIVQGLPIIEATTLFPGNVSSLYGTSIVVSGGLAPYTWSLASGTLPPGLTLGTTSTVAYTSISGTPTATGTFSFTVKAVDANGKPASVKLTLVINAATACLLNGRYAVLYTGYGVNHFTVSAASLNVTSAGAISGYHDFGAVNTAVAEPLTGTCTTRTSNNGLLTLTGAVNSPAYSYAVSTSLTEGRLQLANGTDYDSGTGLFIEQDPTAFVLSHLAGNFALGLVGVDANEAHMGMVGALAIDVGGIVTGRIDDNAKTPLSAAATTGTLGTPDANGRGTLQLVAGSQTFKFSYYIVSADKLLVVSTDSSATAPRIAGFLTRQVGPFDATSLASPGVLSLWGASGTSPPPSVLVLGRLANANATAGTLDANLDTADHITGTFGQTYTGAAYAVDADGRATLALTSSGTTRHFVLYLDGTANGYIIEAGGTTGSSGLLEAQSAAPFNNTLSGLFISGTQFGTFPGPMVLLPAVRIAAGSLAASYATGYYSLDTATGRGIGTLSITGAGSSVMALYIVNPSKVRLLRYGALARSASIEWLGN